MTDPLLVLESYHLKLKTVSDWYKSGKQPQVTTE